MAQAAGFTDEDAPDLTIAVAVALAESGGMWWIKADRDGNGRWDHGTWQVNDVHAELLAGNDPYDPWMNAAMARHIFVAAKYRWTPWTAWNDHKHLVFMPRATTAVNQLEELDGLA